MPSMEIGTGTKDRFPLINWDDYETEDESTDNEVLN